MSEAPLTEPAADGWQSVHLVDERPDPEALRTAGLHLAELDGASIGTKQDLMAAVSEALRFPDYFGGNWDALDECLRDLGSFIEAKGYVLVIEGAEPLWHGSPELAGMLVRSWIDAARTWAEKGVPLHLVFVR